MARLSENDRFWLAHVARWKASGQKRSDYCRTHELSERVFNRWVLQARKYPSQQHSTEKKTLQVEDGLPTFLPVVVGEDRTEASRSGGGMIEVVYGGATIRVGANVDGRALRCVLTALREIA